MNLPNMKLPNWIYEIRKPAELDVDLQCLETELSETLTNIEPDPQFVITLRQKLLNQFSSVDLTPSTPQHQTLQTGLLVTGGILGSTLVLLTGVRGFISIMGIVRLIIGWFRQNSRDSLMPSDLAH